MLLETLLVRRQWERSVRGKCNRRAALTQTGATVMLYFLLPLRGLANDAPKSQLSIQIHIYSQLASLRCVRTAMLTCVVLGQVLVFVLFLLLTKPGAARLLLLFGLLHRYARHAPATHTRTLLLCLTSTVTRMSSGINVCL